MSNEVFFKTILACSAHQELSEYILIYAVHQLLKLLNKQGEAGSFIVNNLLLIMIRCRDKQNPFFFLNFCSDMFA